MLFLNWLFDIFFAIALVLDKKSLYGTCHDKVLMFLPFPFLRDIVFESKDHSSSRQF